MIWVRTGTVTLTVAGRSHQVGPQMCARFPAGVPHRYENAGEVQVDMVMIVVVPPVS
jgi:mannose-6-phosphate isomerase-like protein (cupin superfamily)